MLHFSNPLRYINSYNITELDKFIVFPNVTCVLLESHVTPIAVGYNIVSLVNDIMRLTYTPNLQSSNDSLE